MIFSDVKCLLFKSEDEFPASSKGIILRSLEAFLGKLFV